MRHIQFLALTTLLLLPGCDDADSPGRPDIVLTLTVVPESSGDALDVTATVSNTGTAAAVFPCELNVPGVTLRALWGPLLIDPLSSCNGPYPAPGDAGSDRLLTPCRGIFRLDPGEETSTVFSLTGAVYLEDCTPVTLPPGPYQFVTEFEFRSEFESSDTPLQRIEKTAQFSWPVETSQLDPFHSTPAGLIHRTGH